MEGMTKEQLARIDVLYREQGKEIQQLREQLAKALEALDRIKHIAAVSNSTAAIEYAAQQTIKEIGDV